jgi:hypothetical protein
LLLLLPLLLLLLLLLCRSGQQRIDFENLPQLPEGALARGSRKQTCLVTAATTAPTLLPQDLHYQVGN